MSAGRVLRLARGFSHVPSRGAAGIIQGPGQSFQLPLTPVSFERFLAALPAPAPYLPEALDCWGAPGVSTLNSLASWGIIEDAVVDDEGIEIARAERPIVPPPPSKEGGQVALGPTTYFRQDGGEWLASGTEARATVRLSASALTSLAREAARPLPVEDLSPVARLMLDQGLLRYSTQPGQYDGWDFHDSLFHAASVHGIGTDGYGARGYGEGNSRDCHRPKPIESGSGEWLANLAEDGPNPVIPLAEALAQRRTCRLFTARSLDRDAVRALLRLALRSRPRSGYGSAVDATFHAYPSGGARNEIAVFAAMQDDNGTPDSVACYDSQSDALHYMPATPGTGQRAIHILSGVCGIGSPWPSMALLFAADYGRMADKYDAIAYATILRNVGGIYQTVSLCATALGIGSCCVGGGWSMLERDILAAQLDGRVLVGAMLFGVPAIAS